MLRKSREILQQYKLAIMFTCAAMFIAIIASQSWLIFPSSPVKLETSFQAEADYLKIGKRPIEPLVVMEFNLDKIALGKKLFHEPRLSSNNTSCASCHNLATGGTDHLPVSVGADGQKLDFNAPTVFNSGLNFKQFWDGRAATLEEQIEETINNSREMASSWSNIILQLENDRQYVKDFKTIYSDGIQVSNIKDAIATFERSLITPSRFDDFLAGNEQAMSSKEKRGYELFQSYGCIACHQGMNIGGNMFQTLGIVNDYFAEKSKVNSNDLGRFNLTKQDSDRYVFKVPSVRNVALTAPYFHDGHVETLTEVIKIMAKYQLGRSIPPGDVEDITAFLQSLTGINLEEK